MAGLPYMPTMPTVVAPVPVAASDNGDTHVGFIIWLVILGILVPGVILGTLRLGGFSFVFRSRG